MPDTVICYESIVAAFCLISYADGNVHTSELARFVQNMKAEHEFRHIEEDRLMSDIQKEVAALDKDFQKNKDRALAKIQTVKNDSRIMNTVLKAARIALISDGRILESEEVQVADIHRALGITEKY